MKYRPYPKYKDSGIEWLGKIPEHWNKLRLKYTVESWQNGIWGDEADGENDVICVRVADFDREKCRVDISDPTYRAVEPRQRANRILRNGDLLLEKSGGGEQQPVGFVVLFEHDIDAVCSNFIAKMPVRKNFDSTYLCYVHSFLYTSRINTKSIKQTTGIQNLDSENYLSQVIFLPKLDEQRASANFLEIKTSRIDAFIEKKRQLIELLREKRTALISQAVTKGLDPSVPMKDSGVEWLGEIPSHWEVIRVKYALILQRGYDLPTENFIEGKYPVYGSNGCIGYHNSYTTSGPGVTIGRSGSVGKVNYIKEDFWAHNTALFIREFKRVIPRFAFYLSKTLDVKYLSEGTAVGTLNRNYIHDLKIAPPNIVEQSAIVEYLDKQMSIISNVINHIETQIDKLHEYRQALISAVVTGKVDVRS